MTSTTLAHLMLSLTQLIIRSLHNLFYSLHTQVHLTCIHDVKFCPRLLQQRKAPLIMHSKLWEDSLAAGGVVSFGASLSINESFRMELNHHQQLWTSGFKDITSYLQHDCTLPCDQLVQGCGPCSLPPCKVNRLPRSFPKEEVSDAAYSAGCGD